MKNTAKKQTCNIFWFRRDLRLVDNTGLSSALDNSSKECPLLPLFIFDPHILNSFEKGPDRRIRFIIKALTRIQDNLRKKGSDILILTTSVDDAFCQLLKNYQVREVFTNEDYEPESIKRDLKVSALLKPLEIQLTACKDQVIFSAKEILKQNKSPYTVYTPYRKKWYDSLRPYHLKQLTDVSSDERFLKAQFANVPQPEGIGFEKVPCPDIDFIPKRSIIDNYDNTRNIPSLDTTMAGIHLRFGTVSIRKLASIGFERNFTWLNQLVWRDFFMGILAHFPHVVNEPFKEKYSLISWEENAEFFERWKNGNTGFPIVDAGMRELNETGFMHNRVRMIAASFLIKDLLIDWKKGEHYFAQKLLDFDLASNNGNWQWVAGTGCDGAPFFRIFNPYTQADTFDAHKRYIKKWIPELDTKDYPEPMIDHKMAYHRAIERYREGIARYILSTEKR